MMFRPLPLSSPVRLCWTRFGGSQWWRKGGYFGAAALVLLTSSTVLCDSKLQQTSGPKIFPHGTWAWGKSFTRKPRRLKHLKAKLNDLALGSVEDIAVDENGDVWVRTVPQKVLDDKTGGKWEPVSLPKPFSGVTGCSVGPENKLYICTENGEVHEIFRSEAEGLKNVKLNVPEAVEKIFANPTRIALISKSGTVYMKGKNARGELGLGFRSPSVEEFTPIESKFFESKVRKVCLGKEFTLWLTEGGVLFSAGLNDEKQLAIGWSKYKARESGVRWSSIGELGYAQTIKRIGDIIAEEKDYRQETVMAGSVGSCEARPRPILGWLFDQGHVEDADAGDAHGACILRVSGSNTSHGQDAVYVLCWGSGLHGQLGFAQVGMSAPKRVTYLETLREFDEETGRNRFLRPTQVACGAAHTLLLLKGYTAITQAMIFSWGANKYGQADSVKSMKILKPVWVERLSTQPLTKLLAVDAKSAAY